jgi:hypothetical protein
MPSSHDLQGLLKFLDRPEWSACFQGVLDHHFGPILGPAGMDFDDLMGALGDAMAMTLWGCAFEDFLTQDFDVAGVNVVDEYLRRRGWKEGAQAKAYMKALRTSTMSLYEVSDVVPGVSLLARDILRGGEAVLVHEGTATKSLKQWDRIAARVVRVMGRNVFAGGLLAYSGRATEMILDGVRKLHGKGRSKKLPVVTDEDLKAMAGLFTMVWLGDYFDEAANATPPQIRNMDGDEIVFHTARFPIAKGIRQKDVAERLDRVEALSPASSKFWNWLEKTTDKAPVKRGDGLTFDTSMDSGARVLGNIELTGRTLLFYANSAGRAEKGMALIKGALGELVGMPLTEIQTVDQKRAERPATPAASRELGLSPEVMKKLIHDNLDQAYRKVLDEPVGMLGNLTPRQAVKTVAGRRKAAEWLKYLENRSAQCHQPDDPMATYSFLWMWEALGIADLRR